MSIVKEPGTIRTVHYNRPRGADGRYPVTYWGSVEEQIAEATAANARATSSREHEMVKLYTYTHDCGHTNPEEDERFHGVDDLIDTWMRRNCPMLDWERGDGPVVHTLIWRNRRRAFGIIPIAAEWQRAQDEYEDLHVSGVCLDSYMGECCQLCSEGDEEFGFEVGGCLLGEQVREAYDEFWDMFSHDAREYRQRQEAS